jgi:hypothetical protein
MSSWLRSRVARLLRRDPERVPRWWLHCPICDAELVGPWHGGMRASGAPTVWLMDLPPTREELIAKCPTHGHRPYNDPDRRPSWPRTSMSEELCPNCGLPVSRVGPVMGSPHGPMALPGMAGRTVCGCATEDKQLHDRIAQVTEELAQLREQLRDAHPGESRGG